jgi:putative ABC transport system ATP-binding protein
MVATSPVQSRTGLEDLHVAIRVRAVNHYFGREPLRKQVLYDISLDIEAGEVVILSGPSGSGKTTLLTLIGGLRSVQAGNLRVLNQEMNGVGTSGLLDLRRQIGYIFQYHNLLESLTALQNVMMALELHDDLSKKDRRERAIAMLVEVGLGQRIHYKPDQLSGGQKQRVAIARALVTQPKLVLADEPTASLDKQSGRQVVEIMQRLVHEQTSTLLMVTHDNRILDIADRLIHMEDGRLSVDRNRVNSRLTYSDILGFSGDLEQPKESKTELVTRLKAAIAYSRKQQEAQTSILNRDVGELLKQDVGELLTQDVGQLLRGVLPSDKAEPYPDEAQVQEEPWVIDQFNLLRSRYRHLCRD